MARVVRVHDHVAGAVYVDRPTLFGNPFVIGRDGDRTMVITKYRVWLWSALKSGEVRLDDLAGLADRDLACHCAPDACHADVLIRASAWAAAINDGEVSNLTLTTQF